MMMFNEVVCCFDEQIIWSVCDGDIGVVFGIGFLLFFGGLFWYMDIIGVGEVVVILQCLVVQFGLCFIFCDILLCMVEQGIIFWLVDEWLI